MNELRHAYPNELCHFGILGMKWGVRRYQNDDGSLTDAGRKRYGSESRTAKKAINKAMRQELRHRKVTGVPSDIVSERLVYKHNLKNPNSFKEFKEREDSILNDIDSATKSVAKQITFDESLKTEVVSEARNYIKDHWTGQPKSNVEMDMEEVYSVVSSKTSSVLADKLSKNKDVQKIENDVSNYLKDVREYSNQLLGPLADKKIYRSSDATYGDVYYLKLLSETENGAGRKIQTYSKNYMFASPAEHILTRSRWDDPSFDSKYNDFVDDAYRAFWKKQ